jgi:predicted amidohydrolase
MKIALIQLNAGPDKDKNIQKAKSFVEEAARQGASWILLPELFHFRGDLLDKAVLAKIQEPIPGPCTQIFQKLAQKENVHILLGSILEKAAQGKPFNTSIAIQPSPAQTVKYRKIHLFDAILDDKIIREADLYAAGSQLQLIEVQGFKAGLSVCYDLRFPSLYQHYAHQGANVLTVPSCFTKTTGQAHWESLLRARAIENLSYVLAPNQVGPGHRGIEAYGHSMVVGPWGDVIAKGSPDKEEIVYADISLDVIREARRKLPGIIK